MLMQQPKKASELNYSELTFVRGVTYFSFRFIKISAATYLLKKRAGLSVLIKHSLSSKTSQCTPAPKRDCSPDFLKVPVYMREVPC